jgi:hypothetical protein
MIAAARSPEIAAFLVVLLLYGALLWFLNRRFHRNWTVLSPFTEVASPLLRQSAKR